MAMGALKIWRGRRSCRGRSVELRSSGPIAAGSKQDGTICAVCGQKYLLLKQEEWEEKAWHIRFASKL